MKSEKRIAMKNLPARLPIFPSITAWLLLDRLQAPGYAYGITFTLLGIVAVGAIISMINDTAVDIFKGY